MRIIPIAPTKKGHRVWLEGLSAYGWHKGTTYTVTMTAMSIIYTKHAKTEGTKTRTVTASKGVVIDTESGKVTQWAQGSVSASVTIEPNQIIITKV